MIAGSKRRQFLYFEGGGVIGGTGDNDEHEVDLQSASRFGRLQWLRASTLSFACIQDAQQSLWFDEQQLRRMLTLLGEEVSVTIHQAPDAGTTTFVLSVPRVQLDVNQRAHVDAIGVTAVHRFSLVPAMNRREGTYCVAELWDPLPRHRSEIKHKPVDV